MLPPKTEDLFFYSWWQWVASLSSLTGEGRLAQRCPDETILKAFGSWFCCLSAESVQLQALMTFWFQVLVKCGPFSLSRSFSLYLSCNSKRKRLQSLWVHLLLGEVVPAQRSVAWLAAVKQEFQAHLVKQREERRRRSALQLFCCASQKTWTSADVSALASLSRHSCQGFTSTTEESLTCLVELQTDICPSAPNSLLNSCPSSCCDDIMEMKSGTTKRSTIANSRASLCTWRSAITLTL